MSADAARLQELRETLHDATVSLPNITWKRMFGCDAVFCEGTIFGLVWKAGRIGLKFTNNDIFETKINKAGSSPWIVRGEKGIQHWVLIPSEIVENENILQEWATEAYDISKGNDKK
jgi:TfoX/Sxy family transcriptional regulator of competence genes